MYLEKEKYIDERNIFMMLGLMQFGKTTMEH